VRGNYPLCRMDRAVGGGNPEDFGRVQEEGGARPQHRFLRPPNGPELMEKYAEAFHKVLVEHRGKFLDMVREGSV